MVSPPSPSLNPASKFRFLCDVPVGFAQVMLQPSQMVGVAFIVGTVWNSWQIAVFGILGCVAGTLTACLLSYPESERRNGLYGFNGALVGLGCSYFFLPSWPLLLLIVVGGAASSMIMYVMLRRDLKPFTFPFVVTTWAIFFVLAHTEWASPIVFAPTGSQQIVAVEALTRGVGQVLFQEAMLTGAVFAAAILFRDWVQGVYAVMATSLGLVAGYVLGFPVDAINLGLFGYSAVLCGILFAGKTVRDFLSALAAILLSIAIVRLFHIYDLPAFTFPFVMASWIVLWARARICSRVS
ncbi:MAG: urea transporter [Rhodospirillales bacterium]